jgi:sialate O-acetylesterase
MIPACFKKLLCFCLLLIPALCIKAAVRLPRLVSDGMVIQRNAKVHIWGWANPGEVVKVNFKNDNYTATTGTDSLWRIDLKPSPAGGPYQMAIKATNQLSIKNILIGEVWLCSGQSNMELPMDRVKERYPDVVAQASEYNIRQFAVPTVYDFKHPHADLSSGTWEQANPQSVLHFIATGYFFAKSLYEKYHVPIGIIKSCVGGTPVEAWISAETLKAFPAELAVANQFKNDSYVDSIRKADYAVVNNWNARIKQTDLGLNGDKPWYSNDYVANNWQQMQVPGYWASQGAQAVNGVMWFRKTFNIPASMAGQPAKLLLGRIVDADETYVNGVFVGNTTYMYPPRRYEVKAGILKAGINTIVIRVINNSGRGGFVLDKPYHLTLANGQLVDLKGAWQYKLGAAVSAQAGTTTIQYKPLGLYNGMIAPLLNYSIKGVIWYQGESNTGDPQKYYTLFPALIADWRAKFQQGNFPFLYVQLANYMETHSEPGPSNWAMLREAQLKTLSVTNTGMAVIDDIGEWNDVHPTNKEDVGKRLALAAQKVAYRDNNVVYSGPVYQSMCIVNNQIELTFTHTGGGLTAKNGDLKYFAIAGADGNFVWAKANIKGNKVIVYNNQLTNPVAVRYAWADNPDGANLYNSEGLPASPFRTDAFAR